MALLADTIHNFSDALTAIPLWVAFVVGRRAASKRYTYGYGRIEDLAGLFIVFMIALSAIVAGYESIRRFFAPQPLDHLGWVLAAGLVGAWVVSRVLAGQLYGISAQDPLTYGAVALLLGMVALAATWLPARRATRVDPMISLRSE